MKYKMKKTYYTSMVLFIACFMASCTTHINTCFTYAQSNPGRAIIFNGSCSENISYYKWTFGDGTADTATTTATVTHNYAASGKYTVTLTASVKDGGVTGNTQSTQAITVQ